MMLSESKPTESLPHLSPEGLPDFEESYYFNVRWYDPQTARFITEDPIRDGLLWYAYVNNNPMKFVDPTGMFDITPGLIKLYITNHKVAKDVGLPYEGTNRNISSRATNFTINSRLPADGYGDGKDQGSRKGAYRHTLWQAMITITHGSKAALDVGEAHETVDPSVKMKFDSLEEADAKADRLNNLIGRIIGLDNKGSSNKDLAIEVLNNFMEKGLFTVEDQSDGSYQVNQTRLTNEEYKTALEEIEQRGNSGLYEDDGEDNTPNNSRNSSRSSRSQEEPEIKEDGQGNIRGL